MINHATIQERIRTALDRRGGLLTDQSLDALRVFHGQADGIPGLVIERLGPALVVQLHDGQAACDVNALRPAIEVLRDRLGARAVYLKHFVRDRGAASKDVDAALRDPTPWIGEPVEDEIVVREHDYTYLVRPYDGFSTGLFLEHRENRRRIAELSRGRNVLNTFAYTCSFSVAAAKGGAASVSSVDLSARYLEWGRRNFQANDIGLEGYWFFRSDVFDFCRRALRQGRRYDLIILDPPTFSKTRRPNRTFVLDDELPRLVACAVELLDPGGMIFMATNDRQISMARLEESLHEAGGRRRCNILERPALPPDFAGDLDYSKSVLAGFD